MSSEADIIIVRDRIDPNQLRRLVRLFFEGMVKYVVDVEEGIAAVGGELHADAEARLRELTYALLGRGRGQS